MNEINLLKKCVPELGEEELDILKTIFDHKLQTEISKNPDEVVKKLLE